MLGLRTASYCTENEGTPRTNSKAYSDAQEALKNAEELFFTDEELNKMLPKQLRSNAGTTT